MNLFVCSYDPLNFIIYVSVTVLPFELNYIKTDDFYSQLLPAGQTAASSLNLKIQMQMILLNEQIQETTTRNEQFMRLDPGQE